MCPLPPEKDKPKAEQPKDPRRTETHSSIWQHQQKIDQQTAQQGFIERYVNGMRGKQLSPTEVMQLVSDILPQIREVADRGEQNRYQEVQNSYLFLESLQTLITGQVRYVLAERMTASVMGLLGWLRDIVPNAELYNRNKRRWWGKTVNRPDRNEIQMIKDESLNSSMGSYVELYDLTDSANRIVNDESMNLTAKNQFITAMAFEHLRMLTVDRKKRVTELPAGEEITLPYAALGQKDEYHIVIYNGPYAKKISVPGSFIHGDPPDYQSFHQVVAAAAAEKLPNQIQIRSSWIDTRTPATRSSLEGAYKTGMTGKENIKTAKRRRSERISFNKEGATAEALTAADLTITILHDQEVTLDRVQRDYRTSTYGVAIPLTLTFGMDSENNITNYATQHAHPYTDGAYADAETKEVADRAFDRLTTRGFQTWTDPIKTPAPLNYLESSRRVWEARIPREKYDARITSIRNFFADQEKIARLAARDPHLRSILTTNSIDQLANGFSIQNLITISTMILFNHSHSHFLEAVRDPTAIPDASILAPAVTGITESMHGIKKSDLGMSEQTVLYDIFTSLVTLSTSRRLTQASQGPAHIFDTILANKQLKDSMQSAGGMMDATKTEILTNSTMFSMLVGGKKPRNPNNEYLNLRGFTTAFGDTYPSEVFGACDSITPETVSTNQPKHEIILSVRRRRSIGHDPVKLTHPRHIEHVEAVMDRILVLIEHYIQDVDPRGETRARRPKGLDDELRKRGLKG